MTNKDPKANLLVTIAVLEAKIDFVLNSLNTKPDKSLYMTARTLKKK